MTMSKHPLDTCECGDYRQDHAGGIGGCRYTPDPEHDKAGADGHSGAGPCYRFQLDRAYVEPVRSCETCGRETLPQSGNVCPYCDATST